MLQSMSTEDALANTRHVEVRGDRFTLKGYVGNAPVRGTYVEGNEKNDNGQPQAFLVFQPPRTVTPPHFHEVNQFQVFMGGDGLFGKKPAHAVSVHYAGGHTPYGPIVAGEEGLEYFTLRQRWDPGAKYMPERRNMLRKVKREFRMVHEVAQDEPEALRARRGAATETLLEPEADGLACFVTHVGAGMAGTLPDPSAGGGQYHIVIAGTCRHEGKEMRRKSVFYVSADEAPLRVTGGPEGIEILTLQFPQAG